MVAFVDTLAHRDYPGMDNPFARLALANIQSIQSALDPMVRQVAIQLVSECRNVAKDGPQLVAELVRRDYTYMQSPPGVELLQGPRHTAFVGGGDCDDLAMAWCAYTRAMGLRTYVVGVGHMSEYGTLRHAVGYDADSGLHYELTDDRRYSGRWANGTAFEVPVGWYSAFYDPAPAARGFYVSIGPGRPYQPTNEDDMNGCYSCMGATYPSTTSSSKPATESGGGGEWWQGLLEDLVHYGGEAGVAALTDDGDTTVVVEAAPRGDSALTQQQVGQSFPWGPVLLVGGLAVAGVLLWVYR